MKKVIIILVAVVLLLLIGGGVGLYFLTKAPSKEQKTEKTEEAPIIKFLAMEPFTVNLAGKGVERFTQITFSIALTDVKVEEPIKAKMPLLTDRILKIIAQKTPEDLLSPAGKEKLSQEVLAAVKSNVSETEAKAVKEILITKMIVQ